MTNALTEISHNGLEPVSAPGAAIGLRHVLTPRNVNEALDMARLFHKSGMYQVTSLEQAFVVLTMGMELGLTATQAFRGIHVIKGKPCPSADLMVGLCKQSPACIYFKLIETTPEIATYETHRQGEDPIAMSFTMNEARAAGIATDMYKKYPANMLRARCASNLSRAVYPDVVGGMYSPEEMDAVDITPARQQPVAVAQTAQDAANYEEWKALINSIGALVRDNGIKAEVGAMLAEISATKLTDCGLDDVRTIYAKATAIVAERLNAPPAQEATFRNAVSEMHPNVPPATEALPVDDDTDDPFADS